MSKGFFSQGVVVLFRTAPTLDELEKALAPREIGRRVEQVGEWAFGGPTLILPFRPEVNGYVAVDTVARPWPDAMGDPKEDSAVFAAWTMGHFGPFTYPGGLERAARQAWHWEEASRVSGQHAAFVRVRMSCVFGAAKDAPVMPKDCVPLDELVVVTKIAEAILSAPGALCFFNPNGECLYPTAEVHNLLQRHRTTGPAAQELWANVRMFQHPRNADWLMMDTVGLWQLEAPDHEAYFPRGGYNPSEVARFLRNAGDYVIGKGPVIRDGDTMDGPGGIRWQGETVESGMAEPPREVLRWLPMDGTPAPSDL